jgi:hypothetical protein
VVSATSENRNGPTVWRFLLGPAFNGPAIADEFEAQPTGERLLWLERLRTLNVASSRADAAVLVATSWCQGRGTLDGGDNGLFANLVDSLVPEGYGPSVSVSTVGMASATRLNPETSN